MKIRNGFISNSSSSSFIVSTFFEVTKEDIYKYLHTILNNYKEKRIKEDLQEGKHTEEEIRSWWDEYSLEEIKKNITIDTKENLMEDIEYWYPPYALKYNKQDLVIYAMPDNYIPYDLCKKIIKKYCCDHYHLHMG